MEYKRIRIDCEQEFWPETMIAYNTSIKDDTAEEEIAKHLNEGWRIISTTPIIGSRAYNEQGHCKFSSRGGSDMVYTYTQCIEVFLVKE